MVFSVEALSEALRNWGGDDGALVVVSHDRAFCEKIDFTHVATVQNGEISMEFRGARESDWVIGGLSSEASVSDEESSTSNEDAKVSKEVDAKLRKQAYNAPKRITKLEQLIEDAETKMVALDDEMLKHGSDVGKLVDLNNEKEALESQVMEYMNEWEELEALLAQVE